MNGVWTGGPSITTKPRVLGFTSASAGQPQRTGILCLWTETIVGGGGRGRAGPAHHSPLVWVPSTVVLKKLVDNALDAGSLVTLAQVDPDTWIVTNDDPGLDRGQVLRFFAVNRPLTSTKLLRRPTRGMVGNGLRVVTGGAVASGGELTVESRGTRYVLDVDRATGDTLALVEGASDVTTGVRVTVAFGPALPRGADDGAMACEAIRGFGPAAEPMLSHPHWYTPHAFAELIHAAEPGTIAAQIAALLGVEPDEDETARPPVEDDF